MKIYSEDKEYKLYNGNMLDMLEVIPENSIDAIVTDPPYELGFMGKEWDKTGIAFRKETWEKCLQVLKPGGHMLVFGGSRTQHRIACAIEDAGFEIRDCFMWIYGCYSKDTQVLTDKGYKYFYELDKTEKVMQWDKETNLLSWVSPLKYFDFDIDEDLVELKTENSEQQLTKNHKVIYKQNNEVKETFAQFILDLLEDDFEIYLPILKDEKIEWEKVINGRTIKYKDKVYCLQTKTGAFVVRRIGKSFISGNSGFPKSMNIGKQIDKKNGRDSELYKEIGRYIKTKREEKNISLKELNKKFNYVAGCNWWESQNDNNVRLPIKEDWIKLKQILDLDDRYDKIIEREEAIGEKLGTKIRGNAGFSNEQVPRPWKEKIGEEYDITAPATELAKRWESWGTQVKPAYEPIIVARKPVEHSIVENVIKWGVGGINIDECRVGADTIKTHGGRNNIVSGDERVGKALGYNAPHEALNTFHQGRFPANVILSYDEENKEEVCSGFPITKGGVTKEKGTYGFCFNEGKRDNKPMADGYGDEGSASRYFKNCEYDEYYEEPQRYYYTSKVSTKERNEGLGEIKNIHPTVKPVSLLSYLIRLITPNNGTILDVFNGSGSTGKAVINENRENNKGYKYIGIELSEEYCEIAKQRIEYAQQNEIQSEKTKKKEKGKEKERTKKDNVAIQTSLFED